MGKKKSVKRSRKRRKQMQFTSKFNVKYRESKCNELFVDCPITPYEDGVINQQCKICPHLNKMKKEFVKIREDDEDETDDNN